jgi:hypothetical protein
MLFIRLNVIVSGGALIVLLLLSNGTPFLPPFSTSKSIQFEKFLEEEGCISSNMVGLFVILLLYVVNIVFLTKYIEYIHKQLKFLYNFTKIMNLPLISIKPIL